MDSAVHLDTPLPVAIARLIGRDAQLAALGADLTIHRLITLVGPGGVGKSRLALAAAHAVRAGATRPVSWIDLASVGTDALAAHAIADALGVREAARPDLIEAIAAAIGSAPALIVLDNCEHLVGAVAEAAHGLLVRCPTLTLLATSREALGIEGERRWPVAPLPVPSATAPAIPFVVVESEAVQLFLERARAVQPGFQVTDVNAEPIRHICRALDGLPLALELAAARLRTHAVGQVASGLDDALRLLVGGARTAAPRHRTLRATLDFSHALLSESERSAFRRLSVFAGSFPDDGAARVVGRIDDDPLATLTQLVDKSLLLAESTAHETRFRMLATVRQYGSELLESSAERARAEDDLTGWVVELLERIEPQLTGAGQSAALARLDAELANLRAALGIARATSDAAAGLRIAGAAWRYWYLRGLYEEGRAWLDWAVVAGESEPAERRARGLWGGGMLALMQCDYPPAIRRLEASLQLYREADDPLGTARLLQALGSVAREQGRYVHGESLHAESLALFSQRGDAWGIASAHGYLGFTAWLQGDFERADREAAAALAGFRALNEAEGTAWALLSLGISAQYQGDLARAGRLLEESRSLATAIGFQEGLAWCLHEQGLLALRQEPGRGEALLREALVIHRDLGDRWRSASVLDDLAHAALVGKPPRPDRGAALLGAADAIRSAIGTPLPPCERNDRERTEAGLRSALGAEGFEALRGWGGATSLDAVLADAGTPLRPPAITAGPDRPVIGRAAATLRIRVLGAAAVELGGRRLAAADWGYAKPRELCFLLLSSPPLTKEQIALALWPDLAETTLRNALHTALRQLRRALEAVDWVVYRAGRYGWNRSRSGEVDLHVFEAALDGAGAATSGTDALPHLQRAIAVYRGDFLDGFEAGEWAESRRTQLRRALERALAETGRLLTASGRHDEAAQIYQRAIDHEPLDEAAHRGLMSAWAATGQSARALLHFRQLAELLAEEVGAPPSRETAVLAERLQQTG